MVYWFYNRKDLKATPSAQDAIAPETEMRYRKEGARFIMDLGNKIGLRYDTVATGVVFMHRFYMFHSFKEFDRYVTACCCLFLAGKVEETPKKCKDIIKVAKMQLPDTKFVAFGADPKEEVMTMERILLQTIKFDLQVDHPYTYLIKYAKCLKGDKVKLHKCVQMAWTFVNDSLCTTLCLQWEPEIIAIALMYLAGKLSKFEVVDWVGRQPQHLRWWDMFVEDISMELLEDICHQVLDLYTQAKAAGGGGIASESPPPTDVTAAPKLELQPDPTALGLAPPSAELTPKKEFRKSAPSTPPGPQPKAEPPPAVAAPAPAVAAGQPQFGGFGYGPPPPTAAYGYMYPPPAGGAAAPPPPPPAAPPGPPGPPAPAQAAAPYPPQYPPFGFPPAPTESKVPAVPPPPPPPPAAKYLPPPPPSASVPPPPPSGAPPPPPPPHPHPHPHPPFPPGPSGGPPPRG